MNKYYVYIYLDPRKYGKYRFGEYEFDYEPFYVGLGTGNRFRQHLSEAYYNRDKNKHKCRIIRKIKSEINCEPFIIRLCENLYKYESKLLEVDLIRKIGRFDKNEGPLTNHTDGGDINNGFEGHIHSIESKKKTSEKLKGRITYKRTEESLKKFSDSIKDVWKEKSHPWIGKNHKEETKNKISIANKGKLLGKKNPSKRIEVRNKISKSLKGRVFDEKWLENMSITQRKFKYIFEDSNDHIFETNNLKEFCEQRNMTMAGVRMAINENRKYKGWFVRKEVL